MSGPENGQTLKATPDVNYKIEIQKMFSTFSIEKIEMRDAAKLFMCCEQWCGK